MNSVDSWYNQFMPILKDPPTRRVASRSSELRMSEAEFIKWSGEEGVRAEWVDGEVVFMNAVSRDHADFAGFVHQMLRQFVDDLDLGKVWYEPYQVRFAKQRRRRLPDIFFACNERLHLSEKSQFNGGPDLIVEIISPDSKIRDRREKFAEYQTAGVREYWLVDPMSRKFEAFTLTSAGRFELIPPSDGATHSIVLPGLFFRTEWVWALKLPKVSALVSQMIRNRKKLASTRKPRSSDNQS